MDYVPTADERLTELNAALKVVGRLPRILHGALVVLLVLASLPAMQMGNPSVWTLLVIGVALFMFVLSLRIRAYATREALIVRSYLWTYTTRYDDIFGFAGGGYAGMWNGFTGSNSWYNMGLWSIKVYSIRGRDLDLSATMMGRRSSKRIEELLNAWVPDEMPPDWKP